MDIKRSYRILLVDDSDESGLLVKVSLKPYDVRQAFTVAQAHAELAAGQFDLILIDVMLPDGDGFKMCNELYSEPRLKMVPKIYSLLKRLPQIKFLVSIVALTTILPNHLPPLSLKPALMLIFAVSLTLKHQPQPWLVLNLKPNLIAAIARVRWQA